MENARVPLHQTLARVNDTPRIDEATQIDPTSILTIDTSPYAIILAGTSGRSDFELEFARVNQCAQSVSSAGDNLNIHGRADV